MTPPEVAPEPPERSPADLTSLKAQLFKARASLVEASPFLGSLVLKLPLLITEDPRIGTAGVDGQGICYFDRAFLEALPVPALRAILLHETLHLALDVFPRRGTRKPLRWNLAHDFAVNLLIDQSDLREGFLALPETFRPMLDPRFQGLPAEEIHDLLPADLGELGLAGSHCVRDALEHMTRAEKTALGAAAREGFEREALDTESWPTLRSALARLPERLRGELPDSPSDLSETEQTRLRKLFPSTPSREAGELWFDTWDALDDADRSALREAWRGKLLEAAEQALQGGQGIGDLPGWAQKLLGPLLHPQIPWQARLAQKVHGHLAGRRRSFSRPGRRSHSLGTVLPGPLKDRGPVGVFVDVSGSVGPTELAAFMGELVGILQQADLPVRLITWDASVKEDLFLEHPEDIHTALAQRRLELTGGGGTDPRCVIAHLQDADTGDLPPLRFGVLLTDGYLHWPSASEWPLELLVVCTDELPEPHHGYDALQLDLGEPHD